jgi:vacuolar-type H+-ATPase subunit E/Vma4
VSETGKFTQDILTAAKGKAQSIIMEAEAETNRAIEEAKADTSRQAGDILHNAQTESEAIKRRQMSEARHRLKLREQVEKDKIMSEVLETTRKRVGDFAKDQTQTKYQSYLVALVGDAVRELGLNEVQIHLNEADQKRLDKTLVEREVAKMSNIPVRVEWAKEPIQAMGGAIVSSTDGRRRIINTFDERFEALEPKLLIEAGKQLFGD